MEATKEIKLESLRITKRWRDDGGYDAKITYNIKDTKLELTLTKQQIKEMITVCAGAIINASQEACEAMKNSVHKSFNMIEGGK